MAAGGKSRKPRSCNFPTHGKKTGNKWYGATKLQSPTEVSTSSIKAAHPKCPKASSNSATNWAPSVQEHEPTGSISFFFFPNDNGLCFLLNTIPLIIYSLPIARRKGFGLGRWLGRESVYRSRGSHWSSDPSTLINTLWTWCPSVIPSPKRQRNGF